MGPALSARALHPGPLPTHGHFGTVGRITGLLRLIGAERIQLAQDHWDSIPEMSVALSLSDEQRSELTRRIAEHDQDPSTAIPGLQHASA
jgi:putative addiction module component (TIGR02574 family)